MSVDPAIRDHKAWIGYLQPDGLVVSAAALVDSQVVLDRNSAPLQQRFLEFVEEVPHGDDKVPAVPNLKRWLHDFLEWPDDCLHGFSPDRPVPETLKIPLREFGETLEPTIAFEQPRPEDPDHPWLLLVQELPLGTDLDEPVESRQAGWSASPTRRFERLLRATEVPIGLLSNATHLRLIYAPRGENAGTLTFPVAAMCEVAGRPILAACHMLLSRYRLLAAPSDARLPALLKRSRDYQARVSTALAQQVLDALYELLRGFQAADDHSKKQLLAEILANDPDQVYAGLLTVLMRLVFLLYAEDQGLMPASDLYVQNYAVHGLFERLRTDAEQYPDTMEHRYGAWAQLLALFRAVHRGCNHPLMKMPAREGHLFDPDRYPFLEGRSSPSATHDGENGQPTLPLVPDGTVFRILEKLLMLDGERLSYRTLDVEQIGSVYETMMGFRLELASGSTIALKPAKAHGAPVPINLEELLATKAANRAKYIADRTDYKLTATMNRAVKAAESIDDLLAALERRIARNATPQPVGRGTMVLMPTDERRKSGSHYTPRSLTEPIVRTTLEPILNQLGEQPTPNQILALKVCDPAMGSGAFLVEACRQLADALVVSWATHGYKPYIPPDEDELLHARRLVAQRCLYGVDRNPMAVDLSKLSLWLATLAKDHPFTFLDHNLRAGDSLVGLTRRQIVGFDLDPSEQLRFVEAKVRERMEAATNARRAILEAGDDLPPAAKRQKLAVADEALDLVRLAGDAVVAAFFAGRRANERREQRDELFRMFSEWLEHADWEARKGLGQAVKHLREGDATNLPVTPFHWEIEFPEVFGRENGGFDAFVGNPPFMGGRNLTAVAGGEYAAWLTQLHEKASGGSDLAAHFFRRAFDLLRKDGCFGLIATNTIAQGDTRASGLRWICTHGGTIYAARRRYKWPGVAAVVVSIVHVCRGELSPPYRLDDREVPFISAYLFHAGGHDDPERLAANAGKSFQGSIVLGMGFTFDDTDTRGVATPIAEMERILSEHPDYQEVVFPYIGGEEVNTSPTHAHHRYVINFGERSEEECRRRWPELMAIVEQKVKPERMTKDRNRYPRMVDEWWKYWNPRVELYAAIAGLDRVLVINCGATPHLAFAFLPAKMVYANTLAIIASATHASFSVLQSRVHETWTRFLASPMKDDLRYTPSDCFETFAFPPGVLEHATAAAAPTDDPRLEALETAGRQYYEFRADLMVRNNEGLTKTYNRFHDPSETSPDILRLRELHDAMDRAVLDAYGWTDIRPTCQFLLDYEDEEEDEENGGRSSRRRKPWRYRWPDEVRDEVLARLLKLNAQRAAEERRTGAAAAADKKARNSGTRKARKKAAGKTPGLRSFPTMESE